MNFNLSEYGDSLVQYGTGEIGTIAGTVTLLLYGPTARIADAGHTGSDSALSGLSEVDGTLTLLNGASLAAGGNLTDTNLIDLDGDTYSAEGGSSLSVAGTLTNTGQISVGPAGGNLTANTTLTAGTLINNRSVNVNGATHQAQIKLRHTDRQHRAAACP